MATATTFTSLQEDMRRYLERGASVDTQVYEQLPRLINLAERSIARALKIQGFINVVTSTLVAGVSVYAKPDRWRDTVSINFGTGASDNIRKPLYARSYEFCRSYWPDSSETSEPRYYCDYNFSNWLIVGTPDQDYPYEVVYYQLPPLLDAVNQTNWLTEYAPDVLLYRCLLEATPFLKNDERLGVWEKMYTDALGGLNVEDIKRITDRNTTRQEA